MLSSSLAKLHVCHVELICPVVHSVGLVGQGGVEVPLTWQATQSPTKSAMAANCIANHTSPSSIHMHVGFYFP